MGELRQRSMAFMGLLHFFVFGFSYQVPALLLSFKKIKMFTISSIRYFDIILKIRFLVYSVDIFFRTTFALILPNCTKGTALYAAVGLKEFSRTGKLLCHKMEDKFFRQNFFLKFCMCH